MRYYLLYRNMVFPVVNYSIRERLPRNDSPISENTGGDENSPETIYGNFVPRQTEFYDTDLKELFQTPRLPEANFPRQSPKIENNTIDLVSVGDIYQILSEPINPSPKNLISKFIESFLPRGRFAYKSQTETDQKALKEELEIRAAMTRQVGIEYGKVTGELNTQYVQVQKFRHDLEEGLERVEEKKEQLETETARLEGLIETYSADLEKVDEIREIFTTVYGEDEAEMMLDKYQIEFDDARKQYAMNKNDLRLLDIKLEPYQELLNRAIEQEKMWDDTMTGVVRIQIALETTSQELERLTIPGQLIADATTLQRTLISRLEGLSSTMSDSEELTNFLGLKSARTSRNTLKRLQRQLKRRTLASETARKVVGGNS